MSSAYETELRDERGRWTSSGGGATGPALSEKEAEAIQYAQGPSFHVLNAHLRGEGPEGKFTAEVTRDLDGLMETHSLSEDTTLYRGLTKDPGWEVGERTSDPGFTSTTTDLSTGEVHTDVGSMGYKGTGALLEIAAPAGQPAVDTNDLAPVTAHDTGANLGGAYNEVVLPRGQELEVTAKQENSPLPWAEGFSPEGGSGPFTATRYSMRPV